MNSQKITLIDSETCFNDQKLINSDLVELTSNVLSYQKEFFSITCIECSLEKKSIEFEFKFDFSQLKLKKDYQKYTVFILDQLVMQSKPLNSDDVFLESIINPKNSYFWLSLMDELNNIIYVNKYYLFNYQKNYIKIIDDEGNFYSLHELLPLNKSLIALIHADFEITNFPADNIYSIFDGQVHVLYDLQKYSDCSLMLGSMLYAFKFDETTRIQEQEDSLPIENLLNTTDLLLLLLNDVVCDDIEDDEDNHHLSNTEEQINQKNDEIQDINLKPLSSPHDQTIFQPNDYIVNGDLKNDLFIKLDHLLHKIRDYSQSQNYRRISLIECNLNSLDIDFIFRQFSLEDEKSSDTKSHHLFKTYTYRQLKGLIFLAYITYCVKTELSVDKIWKDIIDHFKRVNLKRYSDCFHDSTNQYRPHVLSFIKDAVQAFNLRHAFDEQDQNRYRNTILLQIGILNDIDNIHYWLANYRQPLHFSSLLNPNHKNYAQDFHYSLNLLGNYRRKLCSPALVIQELSKNIWFKSLNINDILHKAIKEYDKNLKGLLSSFDEPVLESENFITVKNIQWFSVSSEITFCVELNCSQLEFDPEDDIEIKIFDQKNCLINAFYYEQKTFIESFKNSEFNIFYVKFYNKSNECILNQEFQLFDYNNDLIKIFDQYGNIYNFEDNLNPNHIYHILMHSDFEINLKNKEIYKLFNNSIKLLTSVSANDHCELYLDGETIQLNFGTSNQKIVNFPHQNLIMIGTIQSNDSIDFDVYALNQTKDDTIPLDSNIKLLNFEEYADLTPEHYLMSKKTIQLLYKNKLFIRQIKVIIKHFDSKMRLFSKNLISNEIKEYCVGKNKNLAHLFNKYELDNNFLLYFYSPYESECRIQDNSHHLKDTLFRTLFKLNNTTGYGETISIDLPNQNNYYFIGKVINRGIVQSYQNHLIDLNQYVSHLEHLSILLLVKTVESYELKFLTNSEFEYQSENNQIRLKLNSKFDILAGVILNKNQYAGSFFTDQFSSKNFFNSVFKENAEPISAVHSSFDKLATLKDNAIASNFNIKDIFAFVKLSFLDILDTHINDFKHILMFKYPVEFLEVFLSDYWEFENNKIFYHYPTNIDSVIEHLMYNMKFESNFAFDVINSFQQNYGSEWINKLSTLPFMFLNLIDCTDDHTFKRDLRALLSLKSNFNENEAKNIEYVKEINNLACNLIHRTNSKNEFTLKLQIHSLKENYFLLYKYLC